MAVALRPAKYLYRLRFSQNCEVLRLTCLRGHPFGTGRLKVETSPGTAWCVTNSRFASGVLHSQNGREIALRVGRPARIVLLGKVQVKENLAHESSCEIKCPNAACGMCGKRRFCQGALRSMKSFLM
jgi:hypothetical protein